MFAVRNPPQTQKLVQVREIYLISIILKYFDLIFAAYLLCIPDILILVLHWEFHKTLFNLQLLFQKEKNLKIISSICLIVTPSSLITAIKNLHS